MSLFIVGISTNVLGSVSRMDSCIMEAVIYYGDLEQSGHVPIYLGKSMASPHYAHYAIAGKVIAPG